MCCYEWRVSSYPRRAVDSEVIPKKKRRRNKNQQARRERKMLRTIKKRSQTTLWRQQIPRDQVDEGKQQQQQQQARRCRPCAKGRGWDEESRRGEEREAEGTTTHPCCVCLLALRLTFASGERTIDLTLSSRTPPQPPTPPTTGVNASLGLSRRRPPSSARDFVVPSLAPPWCLWWRCEHP